MRFLFTLLLTLLFGVFAFGQQTLKEGTPAPEFAATSINGQTFDLKQLQGKVVLVTFWSTKCEICHSEIPKMNQLKDRYKGQSVVFLALTMENEAKVGTYLKSTAFNFDILPNSFGAVPSGAHPGVAGPAGQAGVHPEGRGFEEAPARDSGADRDKSGNMDMGFPSYFLIDQNGRVQMKANGWDKTEVLDAKIAGLLSSGTLVKAVAQMSSSPK